MTDLEQLKEIEKIIGKELKPCPVDKEIIGFEAICTFQLNDTQQVIGLNLENCNLENIDFLRQLKNITKLYLGKNQLTDITPLKELKNLTQLDLSSNQLSEISPLKGLKNLTQLKLSNNHFDEIGVLKNLNNITNLCLSNNLIREVRVIKKLKKLIQLELNKNEIINISALASLKQMIFIDLNENKLSDINALRELKKLIWLNLTDNKITNIESLKELENLTRLDLRKNQLKAIPEWLVDFNLNIRWEWSQERKSIFLENNPLEQPPIEVIKKGNDAIRDYFEQIRQQGTDYIYEAKLILIGEGGAGKTSLANKIIDEDYQLLPENESESTKGIDILHYQFPYKDKNFQVNIWDFGGQEIYHQTHQFFLSKRSLYFIIADNRKEDSDFYYWLNTVEMLSDNSPLLIIKNEKGNRVRQIPEKQLKAEFNNRVVHLKNILNNNNLH